MKLSSNGNSQVDRFAATSAGLSEEAEGRLAVLLDAHLQRLERGEPASAEELIAEHPSLSGPLRRYLASLNLIHRAVHDERSSVVDVSARVSEQPEALPNARHHLGDYQLDREIGRGGMGVVYEATQLSLGRRVALKVLPFAAVLDDRQIARFQNEAKAAALLHHPHIVPVYGVGCERGVHYYSMQYIEGQSLDRIVENLRHQVPRSENGSRSGRSRWILSRRRSAKTNSSDTWPQGAATELTRTWSDSTSIATSHYVRSIVELIQHVAEALDYAHGHGVVHRDIKPSNLMIDRLGKVWITDFGLARLETGRDLTLTGELVGTLRYMSPEQAAGRSSLVDARTDIYALGVTLYELLTLRPACEGSDRHEVIRRIEHEWPVSCRIINRAVGSDLETILFKAMAKSRDDRYETAGDLANDLQRYLQGQPIQARRTTWIDHSARYIARHARWCASLCLAGVVAVGLLIANQYQVVQHNRELQASQQRADHHLKVAHQVVDEFGSRVAEELSRVPGAERIRQAWLAQTLEYYQSFTQYAQGDPQLADDLGRTLFHAGALAQRMGELDRALAAYEQARGYFAQRLQHAGSDHDTLANQALCDNNLGTLYVQRGQLDLAAIAYERALAVQRDLAANNGAEVSRRAELGLTLFNRGRLRSHTFQQRSLARQDYLAAQELLKRVIVEAPSLREAQWTLAANYVALSETYDADVSHQESALRSALAIYGSLLPSESVPHRVIGEAAICRASLGTLLAEQGNVDEGIALVQLAMHDAEQAFVNQPDHVTGRVDWAVALNHWGQLLLTQQSPNDARSVLTKAVGILEESCRVTPENALYRSHLGGTLHNLAIAHEQAGEVDRAIQCLQAAIEQQEHACRQAPESTRCRQFLSEHQRALTRLLENPIQTVGNGRTVTRKTTGGPTNSIPRRTVNDRAPRTSTREA